MDFFQYLKKEKPSTEYEEAKERIYKLHDGTGNFSYIDQMYPLESEGGEIQAEFVLGEHRIGERATVYDVEGKKVGKVLITDIFTGKEDDQDQKTQAGQKGRILFQINEECDGRIWKGQYLKSNN